MSGRSATLFNSSLALFAFTALVVVAFWLNSKRKPVEIPGGEDTIGYDSIQYQTDQQKTHRLHGQIISNTDDTSILLLTCGSYVYDPKAPNITHYGSMESDSEGLINYFHVHNEYNDDTTLVVFMRGYRPSTCRYGHEEYEIDLVLAKVTNGWKVISSYVGPQIHSVKTTMEGTFRKQYFLMREDWSFLGIRATAREYIKYRLLSRYTLKGHSVTFKTFNSDTDTYECTTTDHSSPMNCNCYCGSGTANYRYDDSLNCIVLNYTFRNTRFECNFTLPAYFDYHQTWYLNTDTALMGEGEILTDEMDSVTQRVKLSPEQIKRVMKSTGDSNKGFDPYNGQNIYRF